MNLLIHSVISHLCIRYCILFYVSPCRLRSPPVPLFLEAPMSATEIASLRQRQIQSLQEYVPDISSSSSSPSSWDIPLTDLPNNTCLFLKIILPPRFPEVAPEIYVSPSPAHDQPSLKVVHSLVAANGTSVSLHQNIQHWSSNCLLGRVLYEIIAEFKSDPPTIEHISDSNVRIPSNAAVSALGSSKSEHKASVQRRKSTFQVPLPNIPTSFPTLRELSPSQLEQLLHDPAALDRFVRGLDLFIELDTLAKGIADDNLRIAQGNLILRDPIVEKKAKVAALKDEADILIYKIGEAQKRFDAFGNKMSRTGILDSLKESCKRYEKESDAIGDDFLSSGEGNGYEFLKKFLPPRVKFHLYQAKSERLKAMPKSKE